MKSLIGKILFFAAVVAFIVGVIALAAWMFEPPSPAVPANWVSPGESGPCDAPVGVAGWDNLVVVVCANRQVWTLTLGQGPLGTGTQFWRPADPVPGAEDMIDLTPRRVLPDQAPPITKSYVDSLYQRTMRQRHGGSGR